MKAYSVRAVFNIDIENNTNEATYEECIRIFFCGSEEEAFSLAKKNFQTYEVEFDCTLIGDLQLYYIGDQEADRFAQGTAVYSLLRESTLTNEEYYQTFFNTGKEF